jgi:endoglucanase
MTQRVSPSLFWIGLVVLTGLIVQGCVTPVPESQEPISSSDETSVAVSTLTTEELLEQSWQAYINRFIQSDGRVIDREDGDRTVSEGQAYAMLRAVMIDDPDTFALTLDWAETNLQRRDADGKPIDHLWAWKWGQDESGNWGIQDNNFASDADIDAATALILAARRWDRPDYLDLARVKLQDIWAYSTVVVPDVSDATELTTEPAAEISPNTTPTAAETPIDIESASTLDAPSNASADTDGRRYLLPGPKEAFRPEPNLLYLNPSYFAPYAFRLFAQVDPDRDWLSLVDSSYHVLEDSTQLSVVGLPSDWVAYDAATETFMPLEAPRLNSNYSFDAYRVWWRVMLDAAWFDEPRAYTYLQTHLTFLENQWRSQQSIPARIDLEGNPLVDYESTAQYGMLYAAFNLTNPAIATEIREQKLLAHYQDGFWDNDSAYYTHNLSWFGIYPPDMLTARLLNP